MLTSFIKKRFNQYLERGVVRRLEALHQELIFQKIFDIQCRNANLTNDFFPVGGAAGHSLMYLLLRVLEEVPLSKIVELGSGQTTRLIDRAKPSSCGHVCYESDSTWHVFFKDALRTCDYRLRPLVGLEHDGVSYHGFENVAQEEFDLLLVDGPPGEERHSRFSCVPLIENNPRSEFLVIIDDAERPGERETIRHLETSLRRRGLDFKLSYLRGRNMQAVISTPQFRQASFFF